MSMTATARTPAADPAERELRVQLAAAYRLIDHFGWTELIFGHLTARVPGPAPHFLINPYGLAYDEVTASNLMKIDVDGNVVGRADHPVNKAGFVIHSAIHMAHSEQNQVVMHTHSRGGGAGRRPAADLDGGILRNHGLLVTGRSVPDAFLRLYRLERACQVQLDAAAAGRLNLISDNVASKSAAELDGFSLEGVGAGELEFAALQRKLDRVDDSYRR